MSYNSEPLFMYLTRFWQPPNSIHYLGPPLIFGTIQVSLRFAKIILNALVILGVRKPEEIKNIEGSSIKWGISEAFKQEPDAELVYHEGDFGKEPMVIMFGRNPKEVLEKIRIILQDYVNN